jgi:hypothetical protein
LLHSAAKTCYASSRVDLLFHGIAR